MIFKCYDCESEFDEEYAVYYETPGNPKCPVCGGSVAGIRPADLPEAEASAERISSVMRSNATDTTKYFWDCECEKNYIHSKNIAFCNKCKTRREHQPDSRINEVVEMMIAKG